MPHPTPLTEAQVAARRKAVREHPVPLTAEQVAARRKGVLRTAWTVAALAVAVYVAFLLTGVLGQ